MIRGDSSGVGVRGVRNTLQWEPSQYRRRAEGPDPSGMKRDSPSPASLRSATSPRSQCSRGEVVSGQGSHCNWYVLASFFAVLLLSGAALAEDIDGGAPVQSLPLPEPAQAVREVFASHHFEFCHEPKYPLTPAEKAWCDLGAGDNTRACPKLRQACKNDAQATQIELREPISFRLPELGLPLRLLLWILLGLGLGMLGFALVRHFLDHKSKNDVVKTQAPGSAEEDRKAALVRQVETDVQRLLERARAEAAVGDYRAAIGTAYAAILRRLEGAGVVHVEPDQTNGDYVRKVKHDRPTIAWQLSEVVDAVESAQFGDQTVTREGFDGVWRRVAGLLAERIGAVLVVGLLLFGACGQPREDWDHSPSGRAGVMAYLGKRGFKVHERLLSVAKIGESKPGESNSGESNLNDRKAEQLVLLPGAHLGDEEWKAVKAWILAGDHALIVAGGRRALPDWIGAHIIEKQSVGSEPVLFGEAEVKRWGALQVRVPEANTLENKPGAVTLLTRKQVPYAAERWLVRQDDRGEDDEVDARNRVLVIADDFLFRNASLLVADNAVVLDHLLRDGGTSVELAGDLTGLVSSNPVESVRRGRLGPALLQLAAFLLVFFACKGARFGRPTRSQPVVRRAFAEHVRALGLHYARAHGERLALGFMGAYASERLRERCGLRVDRSLSGLAEAVATRTGRPVGQVMRMLLEARDAGKGVPAEKDARDLETVGELVKLLEETGGTGGHKPISGNL